MISTRSEQSERSNQAPGSRAAVLRRKEGTRFSSGSDDEVGGYAARSARSEQSERSNQAPRSTMVQVVGTAGGVGTTTVAALVFAALSQDVAGAPQLHDHAAGELGLRLPEGDDVRLVNPGLGVHDCGAHAAAAVERLADPHTVLVLVTAATPAGCAAAERVLDEVISRHSAAQLRRVLVVAVGVFGRHRISTQLRALGERVGTRSVILLSQDLSLAAGGRIPLVRLTTHTVRAQRQLASVLRERLRSRSS